MLLPFYPLTLKPVRRSPDRDRGAMLHATRRMATALGVRLRPVRQANRPAAVCHPSGAFSYTEGVVNYEGKRRQHLDMLPHEIAHAAWAPLTFTGPEDEHERGLIAFEVLTFLSQLVDAKERAAHALMMRKGLLWQFLMYAGEGGAWLLEDEVGRVLDAECPSTVPRLWGRRELVTYSFLTLALS